ncbi:PH domain-containing protein [Rudanella lutea]|uniref:PH domain-containing protein n=1 Tax=Rudanella lutea TaxID=451374 RepID=UPI00036DB395|nr:PH domain-containing protein [Rudanella lutea]
MKQYSVSLDNSAKVITGLVLALTVSLLAFGAFKPGVVLAIVMVICYGYQPQKYILTPETLTVARLFGAVSFDLNTIREVQEIAPEQMKTSLRAFAVGGLFGYYGRFVNASIGQMTWYATRRSNYVLVRTADDRRIVLTPDGPKQLVADLHRLLAA